MSRVFSSKTSKLDRFKFWLIDLGEQIAALPEYLNPPPLRPTSMSEEEKRELEITLSRDFVQCMGVGEVEQLRREIMDEDFTLLPCDGRPLSKKDYPELYAVLGDEWGSEGEHFKLPQAQDLPDANHVYAIRVKEDASK